MKNLHVNTKVLTCLLFFLLLFPSCNNEEIFVIEESAIIAEEPEPTEEETPNTEDEVIPIDTVDDNVNTMENTSVDIEPYINDTNLPQSITVSNTNPSNGVLTINNNETPENLVDDTVVYVPNAGFSGIDSFDYTICDATNAENCDTATVTITIEPVNTDNDVATELKAFPSAYGGGSNAMGGRGQEVYHVTHLGNSGAGSFRDAVEGENGNNRIVVFDVSGTIEIVGSLSIYGDNLTIAGQTAPEGGITLYGGLIQSASSNNVIVRYIRHRLRFTDYGWGGTDAWRWKNCSNVIIDHCSFSWGTDETVTFWQGANDITIQNCLFGEGKTGSIFGDSDDANMGSNLSFLRNAFYNTTHRHPNSNLNGRSDIINNIVFNWKYRLSRVSGNNNLNHISNNYLTPCGEAQQDMVVYLNGGTPQIYTVGNRLTSKLTSDAQDNWVIFEKFNDANTKFIDPNIYQTSTKHADLINPPNILSADDLINDLLPDIGANKYLNADGSIGVSVDVVDMAYKVGITAQECISYTSFSGGNDYNTTSHWNSFWGSVSATPINTRDGSYDTDNDGMADVWEMGMFGDLTRDGTGDFDSDGYKDLEEFLNLVDL